MTIAAIVAIRVIAAMPIGIQKNSGKNAANIKPSKVANDANTIPATRHETAPAKAARLAGI